MEGKTGGSGAGEVKAIQSLTSRENSVRRSSKEKHEEAAMQLSKKVNFNEEPSITSTRSEQLTKRESQRELAVPRSSLSCSDGQSSPKSQKKFISTWRMACDKTKDRTKELLKRWRTMPEGAVNVDEERDRPPLQHLKLTNQSQEDHGWSVHVWATWVKRYPNQEESIDCDKTITNLTPIQKEKLSHFFSHIFDMDRDDIISLQDFESFSERLRHFADWSTNCGESVILEQVQQGFIETFILPLKPDNISEVENTATVDLDKLFLSIDEWLYLWNELLLGIKNFQDLPVWLQYFPKVVFHAINKSASGTITRDELSAFYSSMMGFSAQRVGELIDEAFKAMTALCEFSYF